MKIDLKNARLLAVITEDYKEVHIYELADGRIFKNILKPKAAQLNELYTYDLSSIKFKHGIDTEAIY